jgi:hypothetical protein
MEKATFSISGEFYNPATLEHSLRYGFSSCNTTSSKFTNVNGEMSTLYKKHGYSFCVSEKKLIISINFREYFIEGNASSITFEEFEHALDLLSRTINVDLEHWNLVSLDFSLDIAVKHPAQNYLKQFGNPVGVTSSGYYGKMLQFKKKNCSTITCTDVTKKVNNATAPIFQTKENFLRIETKIPKSMLGEIGALCAIDLLDIDTYQNLIDLWYKAYQSIPKLPSKSSNEVIISKPAELINWLASEGLKALGGSEKVLRKITKQGLHPKTKYSLKKFLNEIDCAEFNNSELALELDEKVKVIYNRELVALEVLKNAA